MPGKAAGRLREGPEGGEAALGQGVSGGQAGPARGRGAAGPDAAVRIPL